MYYNLIFRIAEAKIRVNAWTIHGSVKRWPLVEVRLFSLYNYKTKRSAEYVRKFSTPIH